MPMFLSAAGRALAIFCMGICTFSSGRAQNQGPPTPDQNISPGVEARDLYLEVFINDTSTEMIGAFRQLADGGLSATPEELGEVGLKANTKLREPNGSVRLKDLPGLDYRVDAATQRLYVTIDDSGRAAKIIDINPKATDEETQKPQSSYGTVLNYSLFAGTNDLMDGNVKPFQGISGGFDARFFSPYGTLNQSFTANMSDGKLEGVKRLNTTWSYSDAERLITYRAGDFISGGLPWTRPVFLGGMQVQRNFSLRPDLITLPVPVLSGTAAVPSTLEVFTQNVRTYSGAVPSGPFEVTNFPVFSGQGEAQIVLRDTLGRETRTTLPFYSSSLLLQKGLIDFSADLGFPRRNYGTESNDYDGDLMGVATFRYGLTNWLTLEGHFEGGVDLLNGGVGAAFPFGAYGVASVAAAGSSHHGDTGMILNGSVEVTHGNYTLFARLQHAFGGYDDIASVSADDELDPIFDPSGVTVFSPRVPRSLAQVTLSTPGPFDRSNLNFSYTQLDLDRGDDSKIIGASFSQSLFKSSSSYATAFADLEDSESFGVFAGLTIPFDNDINVSTGYEQTADGPAGFIDVAKSERQEEGSYGWRLRTSEGSSPDRSASASYRARYARIEGSVQQFDDTVRANAQVDGAIAVASGGVFATNRIDDAFAVVDVGAPDIDVSFENRPVGRTNRSGRILVPNLRSYEPNIVAIDPKNLPVDASIGATRNVVVPADRSGVVINFDVEETTASALVTLLDASGKALEAGLRGHVERTGKEFVIGYDGEAYISALGAQNDIVVDLQDGKSCRARFPYQAKQGTQVKIKSVVCS